MNKYGPNVVTAVAAGRTRPIRMIYLTTALGKRGVRETNGSKIIIILKTAQVGKNGPAGRWDRLLRLTSLPIPIWNQYKRWCKQSPVSAVPATRIMFGQKSM